MSIDSLVYQITGDLKKTEDFLVKNWYLKIMNSLPKQALKGVPNNLLPRLLKCASMCISLQVMGY